MKKSKNYNLIVLLAKETKSLLLWKFLIKKMKIFKTVIIHKLCFIYDFLLSKIVPLMQNLGYKIF